MLYSVPVARIRQVYIGLFMLVLCLPFINEKILGIDPLPLTENRFRATRPSNYVSIFESKGKFAREYEQYFNDTYGFRDLFIRTKHQICYWLFNESDRIIIGKDNFLFYKSVVENNSRYLSQVSKHLLDKMHERILKLDRYLKKKNITLIMMPLRLMTSVYPEMLPDCSPGQGLPTVFDYHVSLLKGQSELVTIDVSQILLNMKANFRCFHETDFHWNHRAGAEVAKILVNKLCRLSGKAELWIEPIKYQRKLWTEGGQNASMGLLWPIVENGWFLAKEEVGRGGKWQRSDEKKPNTWTFETAVTDKSNLLQHMVILCDSFSGAFLYAGFTAYFSSIQSYEANQPLRDILDKMPYDTKFLIIEYINPENMITDHFWPEEML